MYIFYEFQEEVHNVERPEELLIQNANRPRDLGRVLDDKYWPIQPRGVVPAPAGYGYHQVQVCQLITIKRILTLFTTQFSKGNQGTFRISQFIMNNR